jgi:hypothetical protein
MRMKSVSSLILLVGTLAYAAMQVGVHGPAATMSRMDRQEMTSAPHRVVRGDAPRREKSPARRSQIYFATAR